MQLGGKWLRSRFLRKARSEARAYPSWICKRRTTKPLRKKIEQTRPTQLHEYGLGHFYKCSNRKKVGLPISESEGRPSFYLWDRESLGQLVLRRKNSMGGIPLVQCQVLVPMPPLVTSVQFGGARLVEDCSVKVPNHRTVPLVPDRLMAGGLVQGSNTRFTGT